MFNLFWEDEDGYLKFEFFEDKVFAHAKVNSWNKKIKIKCLAMWEEAKTELRKLNYKCIYVVIPDNNVTLYKFEKTFGFNTVMQKDNTLLMMCSTEELWA